MPSPVDITQLLVAWGDGDQMALAELMPLVEHELHRIASYYMHRENPGHMLQTTALVNEAYLRLVNQKNVRWQNRAQFFGLAAQIMRRILLNDARDRTRLKRGGHAAHVSLSEIAVISPERSDELIDLDEALTKLAEIDERKSRVVELRYFGGMSVEETAHVLNVSEITIIRDWNMARAWLAREIRNGT
jgi:RNA polymerase sigma factor (TIGR02999 family)